MLPGLSIAFEIEPLGMLFALIASGLWIITTLYAIGYMRGHHEANQARFSPALRWRSVPPWGQPSPRIC